MKKKGKMVKYSELIDVATHSRLEKRYRNEIVSLGNLGFRHLAYCLEDHGPYTALTKFLIIPLALSKGEILLFRWPLRLASANVLLSIQDPPSIALCMGMGIKFYSGFSDGTIIISSDFGSSLIPHERSRITRLPPQQSLRDTWFHFKSEVHRKLQNVDPVAESMKFEHYVNMSAVEEDISQYRVN
jgi:hypothetical protein